MNMLTMTKFVRWALIADGIILTVLFLKLFMNPWQTAYAVAAGRTHEVGPQTELLMQKIASSTTTLLSIGSIHRAPLAALGSMIVIGDDNLQVFEYKDHPTALSEAAALSLSFSTSRRSDSWKKKMHVSVDGDLVLFYMGDNEAMTSI